MRARSVLRYIYHPHGASCSATVREFEADIVSEVISRLLADRSPRWREVRFSHLQKKKKKLRPEGGPGELEENAKA